MKLFKKSVSVFLALLMVFGSVSLLASAEGATYNWSIDTKFYRMQRNAEGYIVNAKGLVIADENDVFYKYDIDGTTILDADGNAVADATGITVGDPVWIQTTKAKKGEDVRARIFVTTDFGLATSQFFFLYSRNFLEFDGEAQGAGSDDAYYAIRTNSDYKEDASGNYILVDENGELVKDENEEYVINKVAANKMSGDIDTATTNTGMFADMVDEEYLTEDVLKENGWIMAALTYGSKAVELDGSQWLMEFCFTVKEDASGLGNAYLSAECVSDGLDKFFGATVIGCQPSGEGGAWSGRSIFSSCDDEDGEFGFTLNDKDANSTLSCDNTVVFTTKSADSATITGTTEYTGYIGAPLSSISGFSLPTASAEGKQFLGWSKDGVNVLTEDQVKALPIGYETLSLTAMFQAATATYIQNVYTMDNTGAYPEKPATTNPGASTGDKVNVSAYSVPAGFTLDAEQSTKGDVEVTADGNAALNIYLKRNQYKATFTGAAEPEQDVYYEAEYTAPAGPAKQGYTFTQWEVKDAEGNVTATLNAGAKETMGLADVTYTAAYAPAENTATIVINYINQETGEPATVDMPVETTTGYTVAIVEKVPDEPAANTTYVTYDELTKVTHYEFTTEGSDLTEVVNAEGTTKLNINYVPVKYTATFTGAENGTFTEPYHTTITAPALPPVAGKTPLGWTIDGTTVAVEAGKTVELLGDVTYTALYKATEYTITYVFEGAAPEGKLPAQITNANMGDEINLDSIIADGWTFLGWSEPEGAVYDAEANVYTVGTSPVTVTGSWVKNTYTVNFWLDDAMDVNYSSETYEFGDTVITPDDPSDDVLPEPGWYFEEWVEEIITVIDQDTVDTYFVPVENEEGEEVAGQYVYNITPILQQHEYTVTVYYMNVSGYQNNVPVKVETLQDVYYYGDEIAQEDLPVETEDKPIVLGYTFNNWKVGATEIKEWPYVVTGNTQIRGYFTINTYNAVFDANGGAWLDADNNPTILTQTLPFEYEAQITAPTSVPVREGYHLDPEMPWGQELGYMDTEDVYYEANWVANEYDLTFVVDGVSTVDTQTFGNKIALPDGVSTSKPGYDFVGWTTDGGATTVKDITTLDVPSANTTYTAVFEPVEGGVGYTVNIYKMDLEGNYAETPSEVITTLKAEVDKPVEYKEAITGFALDEAKTAGGNKVDAVAGDGSTVLNVYYLRNLVNVTINGETEQKYYEDEVTKDDLPATTPDHPTDPDGYEFKEWVDENGDPVTFPIPVGTDPIVIKPSFEPLDFAAKFVFAYEDNEVEYASIDVAYDSAITAPTAPVGDQVPTGYTFVGWAATKDATEALTDLGKMDSTSGKTFYAVLTASTTVKYNIENYFMELDGTTYKLDASKSETKTDGVAGETKTITAGTFEGFTFDDDNEENVLETMIKGDGTTTFKVYYNRDTVKVTINGKEEQKYYGDEVTEDDIPTTTPDHPTDPDGYEFDKWVDGNGDPVTFPIPVGTDPIVIEPSFKASQFTLTFMNGTETVQSGKQTYKEVITVPADPIVAGNKFLGWYDANGNKVEKGVTTVPSADTTYTAKFELIKYTVNFVVDGATVSTGEYDFGTKISTIIPSGYAIPDGFSFEGWSTDGSTVLDLSAATVPVNGVTYYAVLKAESGVKYTIKTYLQKVGGTGYDVQPDEFGYGTTGDEINYKPATKEGFTLNETQSILKIESLAGDGSSVIRVFYDRNKVNVTINGVPEEKYYDEEIKDIEDPKHPTDPDGYDFKEWVDGEGNTVTFPMNVPAEDIVITPVFTPKKFDVTFTVNGETYATGKYDYNSVIVAPEDDPTVPGYTFEGWSTDGATVITDLGKVDLNGNTFQAVLTPNAGINYTVHKIFQSLDGKTWNAPVPETRTGTAGATVELKAEDEAVSGFAVYQITPAKTTIAGDGSTIIEIYYSRNKTSVTINGEKEDYYYDTEIQKPADPTKDGYDFIGWEDEDGNTVTFPIKVPAEDLVIVPVYEAQSKSLSFVIDNKVVVGYPVTVKVDSDITAPADPEKDGYSFIGWFDAKGNQFNGKMPATDTVYTAKWTAGSNTKYTIEIHMMNTDGQYAEYTATYSYGVTGTMATIVPAEMKGFTHDASLSELSKEIAADGSTVLKIYYARDLYEVTWVVDGNETTEGVYYGAAIVAPEDPTKEGNTFTGWTPAVPATMPAADQMFTATWAEESYTITYVDNGNKIVETYKFGETVTVRDAASAEGMTFVGWFDGATEYVAGSTFTMPAENLVIVAEFEIGVYKVTYLDATGAVFATEMVKFGDSIPVPADKPTKEYYSFVGWDITYDSMPDHDIEVSPIFEKIPVKLIPMAGSTTIIDREAMIITGLQEYLNEGILRNDYLDVEGDGYFEIVIKVAGYYGTGAKIELYDRMGTEDKSDDVLVETYTIVVYGDVNGDSLVQAIDSTYADDEGLLLSNWSNEMVFNGTEFVANPDYDPYMTMAADLLHDGIINASDAAIIGDASIGLLTIDQVNGTPVYFD